MKSTYKSLIFAFVAVACFIPGAARLDAGSKVVLTKDGGRYQLIRNGSSYRIKGAGGTSRFEQLAAAGGNSVRTWGVEGLGRILDAAQEHGLTVCVGLWLEHERHGFDYDEQDAVRAQLERSLAAVRKYKDHPAVLMWGVGNEMEGEGNKPQIWKAVNEMAKRIHEIDQSHPTMTVIAELGENEGKLRALEKYCPDVDIVGVNSYGGITSLAARYKRAGCTKPYVVTEHGPVGPWETGKTPWGSPIEATSTEKAESFARGYREAVLSQPDLCLGSYAFLWGNKQETTATWFGMLLPDGTRLGAVDSMSELWTGKPVVNRCPEIQSIEMEKDRYLTPGSRVTASVAVSDPEGDPLTIQWVLTADSRSIGVGGDAQDGEAEVQGAVEADGAKANLKVPMQKGTYRLFAYVYDGKGGAAVANRPIKVGEPPTTKSTATMVQLPFVLYGEHATQEVYIPSGYMGNVPAVKMQMDCPENPHAGKTCLRASYEAGSDWGGVLWQSPRDDWDGTKPGGANLTGATALEFWARGKNGGEVVNFVLGVLDGDQPYADTAKGELPDVRLSKQWKKYSIPLTGKDLSRIKTGFGWSLAGQGTPVTFYVDEIVYVKAK